MSDVKLYTTEEVQNILRVTKRTLYNYIKADQIKAVKIGKRWRISEEALREQYKDVIMLLKKGYSVRNIAKLQGVGISTVQRIKNQFINK